MISFYNKEEYTFDDVKSLIDNEVEESIYLDFKEARALAKNDEKKKEISKDVAAFANSDGGIIIYGVEEENHKAKSFSFIDGAIYTKEWLEQIITSTIQRHIPDLKIFPIRESGEIGKTIYIIKIPKSFDAPHISRDKKFYKRNNFISEAMEEYEIRALYGRKIRSKLLLGRVTITQIEDTPITELKYKFEVTIINEGDIMETSYKLNVYFSSTQSRGSISASWDRQLHYDYTKLQNKFKITSVGISPIYPDEEVNAIRFDFTIPAKNILAEMDTTNIDLILLYPNGENKTSYTLKELLTRT